MTIERKKEKIRLFGRVGSQHITLWKQKSNKNTKKNVKETPIKKMKIDNRLLLCKGKFPQLGKGFHIFSRTPHQTSYSTVHPGRYTTFFSG